MNEDKTRPAPNTVIALKYDGDTAPRVSAKGQGELAKTILEVARQHDIPLYEDPQLAVLLSRIELGDEIPRALYIAVAEVIAFAYSISGKVPPLKATVRSAPEEAVD